MAGNLTRILNNQIYSKTIIASQKIADGTITGSLFSSNVTVPGDFLVTGNLFVLGTSAYTTIASTNTYVNDPLITLNNGFAGTNTYDEGLVFNRGSLQNRALIWSEFYKEFRLIGTTETGTTYGNVAVSSYQNLHLGNITVDYTANITNLNATGFINTSSNISAAVGVFNGITTTGYVNAGGNVSTPQLNAGQINTTGNLLATAGVFNALTVNGNQTITGYVNANGNIIAAAATFSSSQINGNESVTGYLNVTGNILGDGGTLNTLLINSTTNSSGLSTGALQIAGGVSINKDLWVIGNIYAGNIIGVTANVITVQDPLLYLQPDHTYPYNYDIGIYSAFTGPGLSTLANVYQHTGIVRDYHNNTWTFASNIAEPGAGILTFDSTTVYDPIKAGNLNLVNTDISTAYSSGALIVGGGAGIAGNLSVKLGQQITVGIEDPGANIAFPERQIVAIANINAPAGMNLRNMSSGNHASTSYYAVADNNVGENHYLGFSIAGSGASYPGTVIKSNDGFIQMAGGNLHIGGAGETKNVTISATLDTANVGIIVSYDNANVSVQRTVESTSSTTGAFTVVGGVGIGKDLNVGKGATFNTLNSLNNFTVNSSTSGNVALFANVATGYASFTEGVIIGGGNTTIQPGATLKVNSVTAMMVPAGPTAARPSSLLGFSAADAPGMLRFNTTSNALEYYDGSAWQVAGSVFTVISDRQFSGNVAGGYGNVDGTNTQFTLQSTATTSGTIVSINGVMQFPTLAYSVSGTTLTFTEPPAPDDVIDVRILTTTATVSSIASGSGLNQFIASDTALEFWTGTSATTLRANIDQSGNFNYKTGNKVSYDQSAVTVANTNLTLLDSFSANAYTSAKYVISMKQGTTGNVQAMEALLTQNTWDSIAGTAYITTYGVVNTGNTMGTLAANVDVSGSWTVKMYLIPNAGTAISNVKVMTTYIV